MSNRSSSPRSTTTMENTKKLNIALVCDFFFPRLGGVEMHIFSLATHLRRLGHKVIVITHAYSCNRRVDVSSSEKKIVRNSTRTGVRYLPGPIKVYHCPFHIMVDEDILPTFFSTFPLIRWILIREGIDIVHSHQATSSMGNEAIVYASELGIPSIYTDHSLFGFDDLASLVLNRVLKTTLSTVGAAICVSHTCRHNLILRAHLDPSIVHVIPNAVESTKFTPDPSKQSKERLKIVVISRLVYRKGVDLLIGVIPRICHKFTNVDFIIGGDGSKKSCLMDMVKREQLQDRVEFLGSVPHSSVRDVLVRGHIFLNCSLTESFCIAILEAASCGLFVVATNVGGVPEVLPEDMIHLSNPSTSALSDGLSFVITEKFGVVSNNKHATNSFDIKSSSSTITIPHDPFEFHERLKNMYSWRKVCLDTTSIYDSVLAKPKLTFLERLERYMTIGSIAGYVAWFIAVTFHLYVKVVEWWQPRHLIDVVPDLTDPIKDISYFSSNHGKTADFHKPNTNSTEHHELEKSVSYDKNNY